MARNGVTITTSPPIRFRIKRAGGLDNPHSDRRPAVFSCRLLRFVSQLFNLGIHYIRVNLFESTYLNCQHRYRTAVNAFDWIRDWIAACLGADHV